MLTILLACSTAPVDEGTVTIPDTDMSEDSTTDDSVVSSDEEIVRELIAGETEAKGVVADVAWSGGWPVKTGAGTWLFVQWDDTTSWQLAGDFNDWTPEPMNAEVGFYWAEVDIQEPSGAHYKFVDSQGVYSPDPVARSYTYDSNGEISYVSPDLSIWHLERWPEMASPEGLEARNLRVYVPAGTGPWPVLYLHDGQNVFDPESMWGGWRLQDAMAGLEPALLVGIDNTGARMDEYTHVQDDIGSVVGGLGDDYAAFVHSTVKPFVEAQYGSTGLDGVMGSSLGGLISLHIGHLYPDSFDFVGSLSGTLGWGAFGLGNPTMLDQYLTTGHRDFVLYLDSGGAAGGGLCEDLDGDGIVEDDPDAEDNYCTTRQFADEMAGLGYTWDQDLFHWWEADAPHNEMAWAERVDNPLSLFLSLDD
jgi:hypothetical protein